MEPRSGGHVLPQYAIPESRYPEGTQVMFTSRNTTNAQVRRLRDEVEAVMRNTVTPAITDAVERAASTTMYTSDRVRENSDALAGTVRGRPLVSVLVAAAVGYGIGRVTR
jgi:ElaB/YqjD/DUF883 family membrane-anchored ribosome-binding protein